MPRVMVLWHMREHEGIAHQAPPDQDLPVALDIIVVRDGLCADEALFKVCMDHSRRLRCREPRLDCPRPGLLFSGREVSLKPKHPAAKAGRVSSS